MKLFNVFSISIVVGLFTPSAMGQKLLLDEKNQPTEILIEALLYPGEYKETRFVYVSEGDEAQYCLDSSLSAEKPFAQVYPERIVWPQIGGVDMRVESLDLKLVPEDDNVTDEELDKGYGIRWFLEAAGQDFSKEPVFRLRAVGAEIFSTQTAKVLMHWQKPPPQKSCTAGENGFPSCDLQGISLESQAVAIHPLGEMAAIATTGIKPGMTLYNISNEPTKKWQILFPRESGGAQDVDFSSDGNFVVVLLGNGQIHRFDASNGGNHLSVPSKGLSAQTVPPGDVVAVGGAGGEVIFWRLTDGTIEWKINSRDFRGEIDKIAVSGNGKTIATLEYTDTKTIIRIWRMKQKSAVAQLNLQGTEFVDMILDATGKNILLTHLEHGLMMVKAAPNEVPQKMGGHASKCVGELFWPQQQMGPSCSISGGILQLTPSGDVRQRLQIHSDAARWMVAQSPSGTTLAVGAGHLLIWR